MRLLRYGRLGVGAACKDANKRRLQFLRNLPCTLCPIIEPAQRCVGEELCADNFGANIQGFANIHERIRPGKIVRGDPIMGVDIQLSSHPSRRGTEPAQVMGCLLEHTKSELFLRLRGYPFRRRNKEMSVVGIVGFRIQKCVHRLTRYPHGGLLCPGFEVAGTWKQAKWTTETSLTKWIFYEEVHVNFGWLTRLGSLFLRFFGANISKNLKFFCETP